MIRVLVVDDSRFYRRRIIEMIQTDSELEVVGEAADGAAAVEQVLKLKPDVVTMDVEMPMMDGIVAARKIMETCPVAILMLSTLTTDGARATLDALEAGAIDFIPKRFESIGRDREETSRSLCERVRALGLQRQAGLIAFRSNLRAKRRAATPSVPNYRQRVSSVQLVIVGASTGGPIALQEVLQALPVNFSVPILLVQHMPGTFTATFARRLDQGCSIEVREAADGELLRSSCALLAPGGKQMVLERVNAGVAVRVLDASSGDTYKPCLDKTLDSAAQVYGHRVLAVVLTGMGADGREGARVLRERGAHVWAESRETCAVYGMPKEVIEAGLAERVLLLREIGPELVAMF